jgi:hypothetical protein
LLSTFALTATTSYIAGHAAELQAAPSAAVKAAIGAAAQVHGYSVAFIVSASFFALATVASLLLINAGKNVVPAEGALIAA